MSEKTAKCQRDLLDAVEEIKRLHFRVIQLNRELDGARDEIARSQDDERKGCVWAIQNCSLMSDEEKNIAVQAIKGWIWMPRGKVKVLP